MSPLDGCEIWLLAGSQELYGEETLRKVGTQARQVAGALDACAAIPVHVVFHSVVTSAVGIRAACLAANASDACVGVIVWMHTFSPARMWIGGLQALQKPLLHLHTQFHRDLPWDEVDMDFMDLNQSAHGDREFGFIETRLRRPRKTVVGHWGDPHVAERLGAWARAACAWREAHQLKVARFGDNMRDVAVTEGDKVEAQVRLGVEVNGYGVSDLVEAVRAVSDADIDCLVQEYDQQYRMAPELAPTGDRRGELREAARVEAGLRAFLTAGGFSAFTDTFEDLGGLAQLPGIAVQRLMADGFGFGAEGDWKTAVLVRLVKVMAAGLHGGTSFMEDYLYHLHPDDPRVLGAHMLEVCPSIADGRPSCEIHPLPIGHRADPVRLVFAAKPGPALAAALVDLGDRFRVVVNEVELVTPDQPLPRLPVGHAMWRPHPDLQTAAEAWLVAGGSHHTTLTQAIGPEPLVDFAEMAGIELLLIDAETRLAFFQKELRWNQAYYRLAGGL